MALALAYLSTAASAQRITLHEEFTGENCSPCAETNPDFWALCNSGSNPDKLIHIAYMVPIPTTGFYCERTSAIHTARTAYYSVPFAPYGRYDGAEPNPGCHGGADPGHPDCFTQADIDAEAARPDSFNITATSTWNSTFDQVITTVNITCVTAWSASGTTPNVKLRAALVQTNNFATPPGSNGETHFENVVQAMYPDVNGTTLGGTWTAGEMHSYTITGSVPWWVDKSKSPYMVVWMQDDNNKLITQAAKTVPLTLTRDAALASSPAGFCVPGASGSISPIVSLTNTGTNILSSATIYYNIDGGSIVSQAWTGMLAAGATTTVTLTPSTVSTGSHVVYDSVASPDGSADVNVINNASSAIVTVQSSVANSLPLASDFESPLPANWLFFDADGDGENWSAASATNHASGTKAAKFRGYQFYSGEVDYIILPTPALGTGSSLSFWVAHAPYNSVTQDQLEVVYSTDCGTTWTSLYNKSGSTLATTASSFDDFSPTAAQWRQEHVSLTSVPAGSIIAFRATSDHGNNIYVDDVNLHASLAVTEIGQAPLNLAVYPNPAKESATIAFQLSSDGDVQVQVVDVVGHVVSAIANGPARAGMQQFVINTFGIAAGVYNVVVRTNEGSMAQRLLVIK